ncbi:MAG TPA: right-handed parallel beta-helix repeat-containing protein [Actinomycetota bacterium]
MHRIACLLVLLTIAAVAPVSAHEERPTQFPSGNGSVPRYRKSGPALLVCKGARTLRLIEGLPSAARARNLQLYEECRDDGYRHIQAAVDAVRRVGSRILILPGVYREQPYRKPPTGECAALVDKGSPLTYEEQKACPSVANLISFFGDGPDEDIACDNRYCNLQIEGTGKRPSDVIIENGFSKLNAIRADRADGVYFRNFTVQNSEFNSLYVIETDGFVIDRVLGRWNDEYAFLTFASDHGLYTRCEAYGNGDSGLYPGSAADRGHDRPSIEISHCNSHHNLLGYSGTAGNSTYVHDTRFHHNTLGIVTDSFVAGHPGMPQDSARYEDNLIYSNNEDYYRYWEDGTCDKPHRQRGYEDGVVCPHFQAPIGVGVLIAGGNEDLVAGNTIYDNWRYGTMLFGVPASFREEEDPAKEFDTSHYNVYRGNTMGVGPEGPMPNGIDFWWDEQGTGNCWEENDGGEDGLTSDPAMLPECVEDPLPGASVTPKQAFLTPCAAAVPEDPSTYPGCDWFDPPPEPGQGPLPQSHVVSLSTVVALLARWAGCWAQAVHTPC